MSGIPSNWVAPPQWVWDLAYEDGLRRLTHDAALEGDAVAREIVIEDFEVQTRRYDEDRL